MPTDQVSTLLQGKDRDDLGVVVDIRRLPEMDLRAFRATAAVRSTLNRDVRDNATMVPHAQGSGAGPG